MIFPTCWHSHDSSGNGQSIGRQEGKKRQGTGRKRITDKQDPGPTIGVDSRLSLEDTFEFACGPEVPCFTECCGRLELLLTPYDVLRLRKRLGISSADFLDTHTIMRWATGHGFPEIMMKMDSDNDKRCPFVTPRGCSVYEDRPGACRIYPLGRAATKHRRMGRPESLFSKGKTL
jgi:Fe-S-cluster containining protein